MEEGPRYLLALSVLVLAVMFGAVAIVDAAEPGRVLDDGATGELAVLFLGIAGASVGLSLAGFSWKRAKDVTREARELKNEIQNKDEVKGKDDVE